MKLKRFVSVAVCSAMALSLMACTSPKDIFSKILTGNGGSGGGSNVNVLEESATLNKDAIFKENGSFDIDNMDYSSYMLSANGKMYVPTVVYHYPDEDMEGELYEGEGEISPENGEGEADIDNPEEPFVDGLEEGEYDPEEYYSTFTIYVFSDINSSSTVEIECNAGEYPVPQTFGVDSLGNMYFLTESYDYETDYDSWKYYKADPDGNIVNEQPFPDDGVQYMYVNNTAVDADGNMFAVTNNGIFIFDKDFNRTGTYVKGQDSYIEDLFINKKGECFFTEATYAQDTMESKAYILSPAGKTSEVKNIDVIARNSVLPGSDYDFYFTTQTSIMACNIGDKEAKEIVNLYDSDINPSSIYNFVFTDAETMYALDSDNGKVVEYVKVPADQVKDKKILTVGTVYGGYAVSDKIIEFNKSNDEYRIRLVDYSVYNSDDDWEAGHKRFYKDLTTGNTPDIIIPELTDTTNLINKGVFTDLSPYMTGNIKKEDLLPNVTALFGREEKLYCIYETCSVSALMMKKSQYKDGMTFDDFIAWEQQTGHKAFGSGYTRSEVLNSMMSMSMDAFLDPETGKCSFDSPEFVKILEYANTYPAELDDSYWENYDYNSYVNTFRNDEALVSMYSLSNYYDYNREVQSRFGEDVVLTGLPIEGSKGTAIEIYDGIFGISEKCANKDVAWQFIEMCLAPDESDNDIFYKWGIPSTKAELEKQVEVWTGKPFYMDGDKKVYYDDFYTVMDEEYPLELLSKEKAAELTAFVSSVDTLYYWDEEINNIVDEETQSYFAGQKSAEDVAKVIQSRLQIYINERK